jgi:hypothetical protein
MPSKEVKGAKGEVIWSSAVKVCVLRRRGGQTKEHVCGQAGKAKGEVNWSSAVKVCEEAGGRGGGRGGRGGGDQAYPNELELAPFACCKSERSCHEHEGFGTDGGDVGDIQCHILGVAFKRLLWNAIELVVVVFAFVHLYRQRSLERGGTFWWWWCILADHEEVGWGAQQNQECAA